MAAVAAASRERLAKQESEESRSKETLVKNAATYLETFYQVTALQAPDTGCGTHPQLHDASAALLCPVPPWLPGL